MKDLCAYVDNIQWLEYFIAGANTPLDQNWSDVGLTRFTFVFVYESTFPNVNSVIDIQLTVFNYTYVAQCCNTIITS